MHEGGVLAGWRTVFEVVRRRVRARWAYLLVLVPFLSELLDTGRLPSRARDWTTDILLGGLLGVFIHILLREAAQLRMIADTDELTGLWNRRRFDTDLLAEVTRAQRLQTRLCLAYMDLDHFKAINDEYGHLEGDKVLRELGRLLRSSVRQHVDRCYRIGGDEFAVIMLGARAEEAVGALCATRHGRRGVTTLDRYGMTCSIGVVELRPAEPADNFVRRADGFMYAAKNGRAQAAGEPDSAFAKC